MSGLLGADLTETLPVRCAVIGRVSTSARPFIERRKEKWVDQDREDGTGKDEITSGFG